MDSSLYEQFDQLSFQPEDDLVRQMNEMSITPTKQIIKCALFADYNHQQYRIIVRCDNYLEGIVYEIGWEWLDDIDIEMCFAPTLYYAELKFQDYYNIPRWPVDFPPHIDIYRYEGGDIQFSNCGNVTMKNEANFLANNKIGHLDIGNERCIITIRH